MAGKYIVTTLVNGKEVHTQEVSKASELKDNDFVVFNKEAELEAEAGDEFTGGTNGTVTGESYEKARNAFESYGFNILGLPVYDPDIQKAFVAYTIRLREEYGIKFQLVMPYNEETGEINHEGVITYLNKTTDPGYDSDTSLTYWLAGAEAGCEVQNSIVGKVYDGSFNVEADVTRAQQQAAIDGGKILFHKDGNDVEILKDINTLTTIDDTTKHSKNDDFKQNQTIRVIDGICLETAKIFNKYFLGKENNDEIGRNALKNELIKIREQYATLRAIKPYDPAALKLTEGDTIRHVMGTDEIKPTNAMEVLQMAISILN